MKSNITALAIAFSNIIKEWLSAEELAEVIAKNSTPEYAGYCATHDYYDANEAMIQAFEQVMQTNIHFEVEEHTTLINAAWDLAKANNFYTTPKETFSIIVHYKNKTKVVSEFYFDFTAAKKLYDEVIQSAKGNKWQFIKKVTIRVNTNK